MNEVACKRLGEMAAVLVALLIAGTCYAQVPTAEYFDCIKARICRGAAIDRHCLGQGFFCNDDNSCKPTKDGSPDGCKWEWVYYCDGPSLNLCQVFTAEYFSTNCSPSCEWLFYNQCACSCADLTGGFEAGFETYCNTVKRPKP